MAKTADSYVVSRTNATKYAVAVDGPMLCPGHHRCRYRWCESLSTCCPGERCAWEAAFAENLERHYRKVYDFEALRQQMPDLDECIERMVNNDLRRNRISFRSNRAWSCVEDGRLTEKAYREFDICDKYLIACIHEREQLHESLDRAGDAVDDQLEHLRRKRLGLEPLGDPWGVAAD